MNTPEISVTTNTVEHIRITATRSFAEVKAAIESALPELDSQVVHMLTSGDQAGITEWEKEGPKLIKFLSRDHGALLKIAGQIRNAVQYDIGNPFTATKMTRHHLGASLYAPLRVTLFETEAGEVVFEYDRPSTLFGQFGDERIREVAVYLDNELKAALISAAR